MNTQIDAVVKRARGYWFVDGFTEIATGGMFVILAGFLLLSQNTSQTPFLSWFLSVTGEIVIVKIVSFLVVILALWWLKDNFTYPRTGFVRGQITGIQILIIIRNMILFLLLPIGGLLIASMLIASTGSVLASMPIWFPVGLGLIWAILILLAGEWMGLHRFRLLGGMILLAGLGVGIWQLTMGLPTIPSDVQPELLQPPVLESIQRSLTSLGWVLLISGVPFVVSGILTFMRYHKENPQPYREDV